MTSVQLTAANGYLFAGRLSAPCHINGGSGRRHGTTLVLIEFSDDPMLQNLPEASYSPILRQILSIFRARRGCFASRE
jgi:hypothetical protein